MRLVLALLAASAVGPDAPAAADAPITYDAKFLEMKGLDWRSAFYPELTPVAHRGVVTVWTAPRAAVAKLAAKADKVLSSPKVTSIPGARATIHSTQVRSLVTGLDRQADGPVNHASYVAFQPKVEGTTEGYALSVSGRALDQGVLVQVAIEDRQVTAVHTYAVAESVEGKDGGPVRHTIQVPEYVQSQAGGEWLVPKDGVLVVSLGVHTAADRDGKAVVREHVALLEPRAAEAGPAGARASASAGNVPPYSVQLLGRDYLLRVSGASKGSAAIPMPLPTVPSRTLPQGLNARGEPVALPPLPEQHAAPPTSKPGTSEPCATPQDKTTPPVGDPIPEGEAAPASDTPSPRDPESRRAGFEEETCCRDCDIARTAAPAPPAAPAEGKTFSFRIPLRADLVIEVKASARPLPAASAPAPPVVPGAK